MSTFFAKNIEGQGMFKILDECRKIEQTGKKVLHYELGDPDFDTDYSIKESLINAINQNNTHYTSSKGHPELIQSIFNSEKLFYKKLHEDNLQVCIANSAIFFLLICLVEKSEEVLFPEPYFPSYVSSAKSLGLKINYYNLNFENNFIPDNNQILEIVKKRRIKLVIFNNPSNPSGTKYDYKDILETINYCQLNGIFCLFDEVYFKTVFEGKRETILEHLKTLSYIFVLRSFSKEFFMTGFRVGYLIGDKNYISKIQLTNETINSCLSPFIQIAAAHALKQNYEIKYSKFREIIKNRRDILYEGLTEECELECVKPNSSFYIFPKLHTSLNKDPNQYFYELLHRYFIAVTPGEIFGKGLKKHFRMCYASVNTDILYKTIDIIKKSI